MSAASLLNPSEPAFNFEHRKFHEAMLDASGPSAAFLSSVPFWIDPPFNDKNIPAGWANSMHAQAHADFIALFPAPYGGSGLSSLNDVSLYSEDDEWWRFSNFQLHFIAGLNS